MCKRFEKCRENKLFKQVKDECISRKQKGIHQCYFDALHACESGKIQDEYLPQQQTVAENSSGNNGNGNGNNGNGNGNNENGNGNGNGNNGDQQPNTQTVQFGDNSDDERVQH